MHISTHKPKHKQKRIAGVAATGVAAVAVAGLALYGTGVATAGQPTAGQNSAAAQASAGKDVKEPQNIGLLVQQIDAYYGATPDADGVYQASPTSPYAKDLARIEADAKKYIDRAAQQAKNGKGGQGGQHGKQVKPAVVFDIDDTLLLSFDYERKTNYTYNSATWAEYVAKADRPAVFGTPDLVKYAKSKGVEVFYNSGLTEAQRSAAVTNLKKVGADINLDAGHMFLKDAANPPAYLKDCATAGAWKCTTVQYKSGTRKHIESLGYDIIANFGDQQSDLDGGYANKTFKIPNPTYFVG